MVPFYLPVSIRFLNKALLIGSGTGIGIACEVKTTISGFSKTFQGVAIRLTVQHNAGGGWV